MIPIVSYALLLPTAGIMGSFLDRNEMNELMGGTSALPIWIVWMVVLVLVVPIHHFFQNKFKKGVDTDTKI